MSERVQEVFGSCEEHKAKKVHVFHCHNCRSANKKARKKYLADARWARSCACGDREKALVSCERCLVSLCFTCMSEHRCRHRKERGRQSGLQEAGEKVIAHSLHGKDQTAAGYYTAVTGKAVEGMLLEPKPRGDVR